MKKLWVIVATALVVSVSAHANQNQGGIEQAIRECQAVVDAKTDRVAFDACMKAKGFERPKS